MISTNGEQIVTGIAIDNAGNTATVTVQVNLDKAAPTIWYTLSPSANLAGWNSGAVTVTFVCADEAGGSGVASCTPPVTVNDPTQGTDVVGTAVDNAGNAGMATAHVKIDNAPPTITPNITPGPNTNGWNNTSPVTVSFTCVDEVGGSDIASCTPPVSLTSESDGHVVTGTAIDSAGNATIAVVLISIDTTPPTLGSAGWSTNPKTISSSTELTVPAADALAGVVAGEYYLDTDPGVGQGTPMTFAGGNLTTTIGTGLAVGVYQVGVRGKDTAGNWSPATTTMLVVYDPSVPVGITGKNNNDLVPSLANGDVLPGLTSTSQTDSADYGFTVDYTAGVLDPRNDFMFSYNTGNQCHTPHPQGCHTLTVSATSFDWLVIDQTNNSRGRYQGIATVTADGSTTTNPFIVEGIDGDRLVPVANDRFTLKIYAPGVDTTSATPIYQVSATFTKSSSIKVR